MPPSNEIIGDIHFNLNMTCFLVSLPSITGNEIISVPASGEFPGHKRAVVAICANSDCRSSHQTENVRQRTGGFTMRRRSIISPLLIFSLAIAGLAQTKPRLTPAEYGKWETL